MLQFSFILAGQSVCCTICANVSRHRRRHIYIYFFDSVQPPARIVRAACIVHFLFATPLGLAASLRPDGFVSGAVCFVRRTLARSAFLGLQIGAPKCKRCRWHRCKRPFSSQSLVAGVLSSSSSVSVSFCLRASHFPSYSLWICWVQVFFFPRSFLLRIPSGAKVCKDA